MKVNQRNLAFHCASKSDIVSVARIGAAVPVTQKTIWSAMADIDARVRLAAFQFLDEQSRLASDGGALARSALARGFEFDGQRVPLMGPQGIFKPRLCELPISITTVAVVEGEDRPYDDAFAEWPVYVVGDDVPHLSFAVSVEERRFASAGSLPESDETDIRRRYVTRLFRQRLHQREFRERVVRAYHRHCAVCRLHRDELLEAAHIVPDADPLGVPTVRNGIALCTLHHAAFDADLIGITPGYIVEVRRDVLNESDGPMLIHGLQGFHGQALFVPKTVHVAA